MTAHSQAISFAFLVIDCAGHNCVDDCPYGVMLDECQLCRFQNCAPDMDQCLAFAKCSELLECLDACGADAACRNGCQNGLEATTLEVAQPLLDCTEDNCPDACPP